MAFDSLIDRRETLINAIGKRAAAALFPNDFEFYMISLELVNSEGNLIDSLTFPIMPDSISELQPTNVNIKKTAGGITSLTDSTFIPKPISLSGSFGRSFKFLLGASDISFSALKFSRISGAYKKEDLPGSPGVKVKNQIFNSKIKTGYGCIKVLESMIDKSNGLDHLNKPMKLYFYNPALGNNYLVKANDIKFSQNSPDSNMIWNYTLNLTAVAPLGLVQGLEEGKVNLGLVKNLGIDAVNKTATKAVGKTKAALTRKVF